MKKLLLLLIMMFMASICSAEYITKMRFENNIIDDAGYTWQQAHTGGWDGFSSTIKKRGDYSIYGTSGYIISYSYEPGTLRNLAGDFTVEFWAAFDADAIYYTATAFYPVRYYISGDTNNFGAYFGVQYNPANLAEYKPAIRTHTTSAGTNSFIGADWETGTNWHHCCYERRSGVIYVYLDGQEVYNFADDNVFDPAGIFLLAELSPSSALGRIHVDQLSVYDNGYVYGGNFLPLERPRLSFSLPKTTEVLDENTVSLFHFDSDFTDLASDATWLPSGAWYVTPPGNSNWTIEPTSAKFGAGGIYDNIDTPYNWGVLTSEMPSKFWFGSGDFTIEWWLRVDSITSYVGTVNLLDFFASSDSSNYWQFYSRITPSSTSTYAIYTGAATLSGGSWVDLRQSSGVSKTIGDWTHFACVRNGGTMTLYMDGVAVSSFSSATAGYIFNMTNASNISLQRVWNPNRFRGEISVDEFRASNAARYTGNFTPPTAPFGTTTMQNKYSFSDILRLLNRLPDSDTISLFHFDGTGDETNDLGDSEWAFTTKDAYADVTISTGGKFGKALYDGTGTAPDAWWMRTADVDDFKEIGTGDYSLEFWIRANANINFGSSFNFFYINVLGMPTGTCRLIDMFFWNMDGFTTLFGCNPYHGGEQLAISSQPMATWTHICLERYGSTTTIYVNGIAHGSGSAGISAINFATMTGMEIGHNSSSGAGVAGNWLIDELKITKKAVYMGNFTPPTLPYYYYGINKLGLGE